jgi:hypothetical protein
MIPVRQGVLRHQYSFHKPDTKTATAELNQTKIFKRCAPRPVKFNLLIFSPYNSNNQSQ